MASRGVLQNLFLPACQLSPYSRVNRPARNPILKAIADELFYHNPASAIRPNGASLAMVANGELIQSASHIAVPNLKRAHSNAVESCTLWSEY